MARLVQFVILLTATDRRRRRHVSEKGRILEFTVQYETKIKGRWHPVVRYDTVHDYAHKHVFHLDGQQKRSSMHISDFNLALKVAEDDVRQNWRRYKTSFFKE